MESIANLNLYWSRRIFSWLFIVIGASIKANSQVVNFSTFTTTVIVGQEVFFACTSDNFNPSQNRMEILYQNTVVTLYKNGKFTFYKKKIDNKYESDILTDGITSTAVGIAFIIKDINQDNSGKYQCIMTIAGDIYSSQVIDLSVKHIPKPTCSAIVDPGMIYFQEGRNALVNVHEELDVNITLECSVMSTSSSVQVSLDLVKSPNRTVILTQPSASITAANISASISSDDNNVTYTCIAYNATYRGISETCSIKLCDINETLNSMSSTTNKPLIIFENSTNYSMIEDEESYIHNDNLSEAWATIIAMVLVVGVISGLIVIHSKRRTRLKRRGRKLGHNVEEVVENPYYSSRISVLNDDAKPIDEGIYLDPIPSDDHIYDVLEPVTGECVRNTLDVNQR